MATLLHSESRRLYSWWWDSHISPKNSKWLQENLTDMDSKVKAMIKLIEEDADSFARRAEMYYKKRPELMKLVEEFYRAYRALAERYNHATVELRQAHRTMAEAFPNQVPYALADDSPSGSSCSESDPHTPDMQHPIRSLLDLDDLHKDALGLSSINLHVMKRKGAYSEESNPEISKKGLKQLNDMFDSGGVARNLKLAECQDVYSPLSGQDLKTQVLSESQRALAAETEVQTLKTTLAEILAEKEAMFLQFQQNLEKLSNLERGLKHSQDDSGALDEQSSRAENEVKVLKETLAKLEAQRDDAYLQHEQCTDRISSLQKMLIVARKDAEGLSEQASRAESEAQNLREELSKMKVENEAGLSQYNQCLETISVLENKISCAEEDIRMLKEQTEKAETEVKTLKEALAKLNEEKEATAVQYKQCLENIAKMESEILHAKEDVERLNREVSMGAAKLKSAEERTVQLEISNHSLQSEAENLAHDIAMKDLELAKKQDELEKLKMFAQEEHTRFLQIEGTLQNLQKLHSQSEDDQRALALELKNSLQMLKDVESNKHGLEEEIRQVTEENRSLSELNLSTMNTVHNLQTEISSLKGIKEKLEEKFSLQAEASTVLHQEIYSLKEEIMVLNRKYQGLVAQVESVGINPDCLVSSLKGLQYENSKLKEICKKDVDEREVLYKKLKDMDKLMEENADLGSSLSEMNGVLKGYREKVKELQDSSLFLQEEKSSLVAEKATLLSQLQIITDNMQMVLEKNTLLETSLSGANVELEGLRVKSKNLEEFCQLLIHEKSNLLNERSSLVAQLESVAQRLGNLENRFTKLEEKYAGLEMDKQITSCQVQELQSCLTLEKQERANYKLSNEMRLAGLENHVKLLREESRLSKKEFEEQLDKAVTAQVEIFILQKFIKDLEEKNSSVLIECHKHVEASKLSDKLIADLETENLEQQVEVEFLLDEIEKLRMGIHQVFSALQMVPDSGHENWIEQEQIPLSHILDNIEGLKSSVLSNNDDKQQLLIENSVLLTLLEQLRLEGSELVSDKTILEQDFDIMTEQCAMLQKDKQELLEMNRQLHLKLTVGVQHEAELKAEMESLCVKLVDMEGAYQVLQEENTKVLKENNYLLKKFSDLKEEMHVLEEENINVIQETVALSNLSLVFKSFGDEKVAEMKALTEDLNSLNVIKGNLMEEIRILGQRLEMKEEENLHLNESAKKLGKELDNVGELNGQLDHQLSVIKDFLRQKETELSDAEQKLELSKMWNMELCKTIEELKKECEKSKQARENAEKQILELSEDNTNQTREIEHLREVNGNLELEVGALSKEIEECRIREESLSSELQERNNEFELWESEAATFYFDLQISSVREVLLEDKIQGLTGVCGSLEEESATKSVEIEKMKVRASFLESEIEGLKAKLSAYVPVIASLRDDIVSLEYNALRRTRLSVSGSQQQKDKGMSTHPTEMSCQELMEDQCATTPSAISDLQKMQSRIRAIEKAVVEEMERLAVQESKSTNTKPEAAVKEREDLKLESASNQEKITLREKMDVGVQLGDKVKSKKTKPEFSEARNGILMKDIPLDQVSDGSLYGISRRRNRRSDDHLLELWETVEQDRALHPMVVATQKLASTSGVKDSSSHRLGDVEKSQGVSQELQAEKELGIDKLEVCTSSVEPNQERSRKILERLASDVKKLMSLQATVLDMKKRIEMNNKSKKDKQVQYGTVKLQLQQVEEAVMELVDVNDQLTKTIEERPMCLDGKTRAESEEAGKVHGNRLAEEARKGSEKIGRLQFEVQNIEYVMLKLEDETKSRVGKSKFPVSKASVFLRIFLSSGSRTNGRRKKSRFCGCMRPSTSSN